MKHTHINTIYKIVCIACLSIFFVNCEAEDGAQGPNGLNGIDGTDGINGVDGIDGENGVGFEELTQFGSISLTLNGTRFDTNEAFTDTKTLAFTAIDANSLIDHNSFTVESTPVQSTNFNLLRFLNTPDDDSQEFTTEIGFNVINLGTDTQEFQFTIELNEYNIVFEDLVVLQMNNTFDNQGEEEPMSNLSITNFNFNEGTQNLTFSFSFDVDGANNDSTNDLTISGEVDVIVLKAIPGVDVLDL